MKPLSPPMGGKPIDTHDGPNRKERRKLEAERRRWKKQFKKIKATLTKRAAA